MSLRNELVVIVQAGVTEFRKFDRVVKVRQMGRIHQVLGVYKTGEHGSYYDARKDAIARLERAESESNRMAATNCDGLLFSMEGI